MSRIAGTFERLARAGRKALIPFIEAGDPTRATTVPLMHALVEAGADVIELGVPFSDPMADGPVIQAACERALKGHVRLRDVLAMVREFRAHNAATPVVLMGYLNPIEALGYEVFAREAAAAGVDGVLTVDLPPEEATGLLGCLRAEGLDAIFLLAPTSSPERIRLIAEAASGFIYYVSLRGVTGAGHLDVDEVRCKLAAVRRVTCLPIGVGFGISGPEVAARVAVFADAVIVGSAIVRRMEMLAAEPDRILKEIPAFLKDLRAAIDARSWPATAVMP